MGGELHSSRSKGRFTESGSHNRPGQAICYGVKMMRRFSRGETFVAEIFSELVKVNIIGNRRHRIARTQLEQGNDMALNNTIETVTAEANLQHHRKLILTSPRSATSPHLESDASQTPDINLSAIAAGLVRNDLWGHPVD